MQASSSRIRGLLFGRLNWKNQLEQQLGSHVRWFSGHPEMVAAMAIDSFDCVLVDGGSSFDQKTLEPAFKANSQGVPVILCLEGKFRLVHRCDTWRQEKVQPADMDFHWLISRCTATRAASREECDRELRRGRRIATYELACHLIERRLPFEQPSDQDKLRSLKLAATGAVERELDPMQQATQPLFTDSIREVLERVEESDGGLISVHGLTWATLRKTLAEEF